MKLTPIILICTFLQMSAGIISLTCAPPAQAASVAPVFNNDTVADTLSFNDTFGHNVQLGTYDPATGLWTSTGVAGGFTNLTVSGNGTVAGTFGITGATTVGALSATGVVSGAGFTNLFASPPPMGSTAPNTGAFTTLSASGMLSGAGFNSLISAPPVGVGSVTPNGGAFTSLSASGTVSGTGFANYLLSPPAIGNTAPNTAKFTVLQSADNARSLQSFGAAGNGTTDDTTAVQTAMNSGIPLTCNGTFKITSLVTITNTSMYLQGGGTQGCKFLLNTTSSMFYFNLTSSLLNQQHVEIRDVRVQVGAVITSVSGPAQTAAFYISFPAGSLNTASPTVTIEDVQIQGTVAGNYIINGVYLNDVTDAKIDKLTCEANRSAFIIGSHCLVYDGTHSPVLLTASNVYCDFCGIGIYAVQAATNGWQGIRIYNSDCVYCDQAISLNGALDGKSDQAIIIGDQGAVQNVGVFVQNVLHVNATANYYFLADMAISGGTHYTFPTCYEYNWTFAIPSNGGNSSIQNNTCDGTQVTGSTGRYGATVAGFTNPLNTIIGNNTFSNMEYAGSVTTGSTGVTLGKNALKNVVTGEYQNTGTAGNTIYIPPLARKDGNTSPAGQVGEVLRSTVLIGSAVSLVNGTAKDVTTLALTAGHWTCYGNETFNIGTTAATAISGGLSTTANTLNFVPPNSVNQLVGTFTASSSDVLPINTSTFDSASASTLHLVANASFGAGTATVYGFVECQRTQ